MVNLSYGVVAAIYVAVTLVWTISTSCVQEFLDPNIFLLKLVLLVDCCVVSSTPTRVAGKSVSDLLF